MNLYEMTTKIFAGVGGTLFIFFTTLVISLVLGLLICFMRQSRVKILSAITKVFISILRGTPLMLQLIVWFYAPYYVFGIKLDANWRMMAIVIGFSINYAAYFAEIYRSGIESIPIGQYEASFILGYNNSQTFTRIVLPQMIKRVLPPATNEIITLIKDTSLAFVLSYAEIFTLAKQVAAANTTVLPLFIAGGFYYIFNYLVAFVMERIEQSLNYYR